MGVRTDRTRLSEAIASYLQWREQRGTAAGTLANDRVSLLAFQRSAGDLLTSSLEAYHVEAWLFGPGGLTSEHRDLNGRLQLPVAPSTLNGNLQRLRAFFGWCQRRGHVRRDPVADVRPLKTPQRRPVSAEHDVMLAMLESATDPRDRAALAVAVNTALRAANIRGLRVGDLDLDRGTLRVFLVKSYVEKLLPVTADLDQEMRAWLTTYAETIGRPLLSTDYLVPARHCGRYRWVTHEDGRREKLRTRAGYLPTRPPAKLEHIVQRAYSKVTGEDVTGVGMHTIRRGVARALFDQLSTEGGYDHALRTVSALLGHKNASTTEIYLGTSSEERKLDEVMRGKPFLTAMVPAQGNVVPLRAVQ